MPAASVTAKAQISTIIKRFKFEELEEAVFPIFPELSWKSIKSKIVNDHSTLTTVHTLPLIERAINKEKIRDNILEDRLLSLEAIDVSRHYKKRVWYGNEFKGKTGSTDISLEEIENKVEDNVGVHNMAIRVKAVEHEGIIFVVMKEKHKKKGPKKRMMPVFFALVKNETFFFCSKRLAMKNLLTTLTDSLGFKSWKTIKLTGKNIPSLVQMLLARKAAALQGEIVKTSLPFKRAPPVKTALGLDFTQHKQREEYVEKCFGENPPVFEVLKVRSLDQKWRDDTAREKVPHSSIYTEIQFRSTNIPNFLKNLTAKKILKAPLPCYAANVLSLGRNDLTMKDMDQNQETSAR